MNRFAVRLDSVVIVSR